MLLIIALCVLLSRRIRAGRALVVMVLCTGTLLVSQRVEAEEGPQVSGLAFHADGQGILGVSGPASTQVQTLVGAVYGELQVRPLVIRGPDGDVQQELLSERALMQISAAFRPWRDLTVSLWLPLALNQRGSWLFEPDQSLPRTALGDITTRLKWVMRPTQEGRFGWAFLLDFTVPTGTDESYLSGPGVSVTPGVAGGWLFSKWRVLANAQLRLQSSRVTGEFSEGVSLVLQGGASRRLGGVLSSARFDASVRWQTSLIAPFQALYGEQLEGVVALSWTLEQDIELQVGSGFGLWPGVGVPAIRPFVSLRYSPSGQAPKAPKVVEPLGVPASGT